MDKKTVVTLKDVAKFAGVSTGTVSKYINDVGSVKEKNRKLIQNAIDVLQYTPNIWAKKLATGKSNNILLYIITDEAIAPSTWLHELPLIQSINDYLREVPYSLQIKMTSHSLKKEIYSYIKESIASKTIDGIMILSPYEIEKNTILLLTNTKTPFVLIDSHNPILRTNEILFDNFQISWDLIEYLHSLGHNNIGLISYEGEHIHANEREKGFMEAIKKYNITVHKQWIGYGDFSIESGYLSTLKILDNKEIPSAIVCCNDEMAVGAIKAVKSKGLNVPEDISVVGIDNSIIATAVSPTLTTVNIPMNKIGSLSIKELLKSIENPEYEIPRTVLQCDIVFRKSIGRAKKQ